MISEMRDSVRERESRCLFTTQYYDYIYCNLKGLIFHYFFDLCIPVAGERGWRERDALPHGGGMSHGPPPPPPPHHPGGRGAPFTHHHHHGGPYPPHPYPPHYMMHPPPPRHGQLFCFTVKK